MKQLTDLLDELVRIKAIAADGYRAEELMEFRKQHGEATPFILAARHVPGYHELGNTFCAADLCPILQTIIQLYFAIDNKDPVHVPTSVKWNIAAYALNVQDKVKDDIEKLAAGCDDNYVSLLADAVSSVCGPKVATELGL